MYEETSRSDCWGVELRFLDDFMHLGLAAFQRGEPDELLEKIAVLLSRKCRDLARSAAPAVALMAHEAVLDVQILASAEVRCQCK